MRRREIKLVRQHHIEKLSKAQNGLCFYCGERFTPHTKQTLDHFMPRSKGGANSLKNYVLSCKPCNQRKGKRLPSVPEIKVFKELQMKMGLTDE